MRNRSQLRRLTLPALLAALALFAAACGGGGSEATPTTEARDLDTSPTATDGDAPAGTDGNTPASSGGAEGVTFDFPTGEAVLVAAGYEHPGDFVDNTGAYLPVNGKPTVVFVDAIW